MPVGTKLGLVRQAGLIPSFEPEGYSLFQGHNLWISPEAETKEESAEGALAALVLDSLGSSDTGTMKRAISKAVSSLAKAGSWPEVGVGIPLGLVFVLEASCIPEPLQARKPQFDLRVAFVNDFGGPAGSTSRINSKVTDGACVC